MKSATTIEERRKYPRVRMRGMAIAKVRSPSLPPATIIEISPGGMAFQYREKDSSHSVVHKIDIIWADYVSVHHLKGLPIQTVSDEILDHGRQNGTAVTRRKAVKFENLSADQRSALDRLIREQGSIIS